MLPDGSLLRSNDSGYHDNSHVNHTIKTCVEGCTCTGLPATTIAQTNEQTTVQTTEQTRTQEDNTRILNVTQPEVRRHSDSSDGSYCDCNFCLEQGIRNQGGPGPSQRIQEDPIARFRDQITTTNFEGSVSSENTKPCSPQTLVIPDIVTNDDPLYPHNIATTRDVITYRDTCSDVTNVHEESYPSHLTKFREIHNNENSMNSDDSNASSMVSFNCQDDIMTSSPVTRDTRDSDHVTSGYRDEGSCHGNSSSCHGDNNHDDTAAMLDVGSLFLLPSETPQVLGVTNTGLTDSMIVMGSNSHVTRLSDSEDEM